MPALEKCILHFCLNKLLLCSFCSSALACVWEFFVPYLHSFKCAEQESGLSINVFWKIGKCKLFSCVWLCDHMDCSQARLPLCMEFSRQEYWSGVAIPFSRWSSQPRDQTQVFSITGRFFTIWATREARVLNKWPGITSLILCPSSTMCRLMPKESTSTRRTLLGSICQEKQSNPNHMAHIAKNLHPWCSELHPPLQGHLHLHCPPDTRHYFSDRTPVPSSHTAAQELTVLLQKCGVLVPWEGARSKTSQKSPNSWLLRP